MFEPKVFQSLFKGLRKKLICFQNDGIVILYETKKMFIDNLR